MKVLVPRPWPALNVRYAAVQKLERGPPNANDTKLLGDHAGTIKLVPELFELIGEQQTQA